MKFIEREDINVEKWDDLVKVSNGQFFSFSWYLDSLADNWCILMDEDYERGIALPYTSKFGVDTLYVPIFSRNVEWFGEKIDPEKLHELITSRFKSIDIAFTSPLLGEPATEYIYQHILPGVESKSKKQADRMLKKAMKHDLAVTLSDDYRPTLSTIRAELGGKFEGVNEKTIARLERLIIAAQRQNALQVFSIGEEGGILCLMNEQSLLYLKGTTTSECKGKGGMYLLMKTAIEEAQDKGLEFDFGGSRVEGVRRFNTNLGGVDETYYHYNIDNSPWWFRVLKSVKKSVRK